MPRTAEAMVSAYWIAAPPTRLLSPTGMVCDLVWVSTRSGHRKAVQDVMSVRTAPAETAGRKRAWAVGRKTRHQLAPSSRAASTRETGMALMKEWKTKTATGRATDGRMTAQYVPSRPSARNSMNCGRTSASVGSMSPARIRPNTTYFPRKFRWTRAKATIEHTTTVKITVRVEMMKLLTYHQPRGLESQAKRYASKVQLFDQGAVGCAAISSLGRSEVMSAHRNGMSQISAKSVTQVAASRLNAFPPWSGAPRRRAGFVSAAGAATVLTTVFAIGRAPLRRSQSCCAAGPGTSRRR